MLADLGKMSTAANDRYAGRVEPIAITVLTKAAVAGVLGLIALVASLVISLRVGRGLVRDLRRLRKEAHEISGVRLPAVMRRLAAGERVDVDAEAPLRAYGPDELGQVGQALGTLQRAAVEAAVKQAEMRRGVSEVFVNLARRSQVLLHRQLTLLDTMERRTEDAGELADLFRLDHLTTRMRRHAEGLVILSGAAPSRQWRKPIRLMDVVRAAVAEVEAYERIEVRRMPRLALSGPAVADLTHLVAELVENATVFSPPHTAVHVVGERVSNGFALEIHDRGLGMSPEALLEANLRLAETPEFELSDTDRLGLFVVSRLAQRQGVRVSLQPSPYGGTTAVVLIPLGAARGEPSRHPRGMGRGHRRAAAARRARDASRPRARGRGRTAHPGLGHPRRPGRALGRAAPAGRRGGADPHRGAAPARPPGQPRPATEGTHRGPAPAGPGPRRPGPRARRRRGTGPHGRPAAGLAAGGGRKLPRPSGGTTRRTPPERLHQERQLRGTVDDRTEGRHKQRSDGDGPRPADHRHGRPQLAPRRPRRARRHHQQGTGPVRRRPGHRRLQGPQPRGRRAPGRRGLRLPQPRQGRGAALRGG
ncbi:hypothetical protein GCM10020000_68730 [Streptomyces olivoverticillatus]